jgi:hypothetical protein
VIDQFGRCLELETDEVFGTQLAVWIDEETDWEFGPAPRCKRLWSLKTLFPAALVAISYPTAPPPAFSWRLFGLTQVSISVPSMVKTLVGEMALGFRQNRAEEFLRDLRV